MPPKIASAEPTHGQHAGLLPELAARGYAYRSRGEHPGLDSVCDALGRTLLKTDVRPSATKKSLVCSTRPLGPHTDHYRADFIAWECVTSAEADGATFVVDPAPAFNALSAADKELIGTARVFEHRVFEDDLPSRPIVDNAVCPERFYFTYWLARTATAAESQAIDRFREQLERPALAVRFRLSPGDLLVIDNRRVLHGRDAFTGHRHLIRAWISANDCWEPKWLDK
jgi:alpha-ketoglutarate-dependent taurine dioxygenase